MKRSKAQALIAVLLLLALVGIFAGALGTMWEAELKTRTLERDGMQALYLAQAGMERAKTWVSNNYSATGTISFPSSDWYSLPLSEANQRYRCVITDLGSGVRSIQSFGQVLDSNSNVIASRAMRVQIEGIGVDVHPQHDPADRGDDKVTPGSWREF